MLRLDLDDGLPLEGENRKINRMALSNFDLAKISLSYLQDNLDKLDGMSAEEFLAWDETFSNLYKPMLAINKRDIVEQDVKQIIQEYLQIYEKTWEPKARKMKEMLPWI